MMRAVVTSGTGPASRRYQGGPVYGKTGTAEFDNNPNHAHSWFIGYQGDIAFAVFVENGGLSAPRRRYRSPRKFLNTCTASVTREALDQSRCGARPAGTLRGHHDRRRGRRSAGSSCTSGARPATSVSATSRAYTPSGS